MNRRKSLVLAATAAGILLCTGVMLQASTLLSRQYYSSWSYYPQRSYHYRSYYYKPTPDYEGYKYHYVIYYPTQPRYYYYYNPYRNNYWGRFDTQGKDGKQYSLLAEKDRKEKLTDIQESAFPTPAAMPGIPESDGKDTIEPPPNDAPKQ